VKTKVYNILICNFYTPDMYIVLSSSADS